MGARDRQSKHLYLFDFDRHLTLLIPVAIPIPACRRNEVRAQDQRACSVPLARLHHSPCRPRPKQQDLYSEWRPFYIDYTNLKRELKVCLQPYYVSWLALRCFHMSARVVACRFSHSAPERLTRSPTPYPTTPGIDDMGAGVHVLCPFFWAIGVSPMVHNA